MQENKTKQRQAAIPKVGDCAEGKSKTNRAFGVINETRMSDGARKEMMYRIKDIRDPRPQNWFFADQIRIKKPPRKCWWHGQDAWVLCGNGREGYCLLTGDWPLYDALVARDKTLYQLPLGRFSDSVVTALPEEYREQQH